MPRAIAGTTDVQDPLKKIKEEVKNLFLIESERDQAYNSCLAVTGEELIQASLVNLRTRLWSHNFVKTISAGYEHHASNRNFNVEVDRVDYCASHLQVNYGEQDGLDVDMNDIDDQGVAEQLLNLFCLVKARK